MLLLSVLDSNFFGKHSQCANKRCSLIKATALPEILIILFSSSKTFKPLRRSSHLPKMNVPKFVSIVILLIALLSIFVESMPTPAPQFPFTVLQRKKHSPKKAKKGL